MKTIPQSPKNVEEAGEHYGSSLPDIIKKFKKGKKSTAQYIFKEVTKFLLHPCTDMVHRKPKIRPPHCNVKLHQRWSSMKRARRRAARAVLEVDWEEYKRTRNSFQK